MKKTISLVMMVGLFTLWFSSLANASAYVINREVDPDLSPYLSVINNLNDEFGEEYFLIPDDLTELYEYCVVENKNLTEFEKELRADYKAYKEAGEVKAYQLAVMVDGELTIIAASDEISEINAAVVAYQANLSKNSVTTPNENENKSILSPLRAIVTVTQEKTTSISGVTAYLWHTAKENNVAKLFTQFIDTGTTNKSFAHWRATSYSQDWWDGYDHSASVVTYNLRKYNGSVPTLVTTSVITVWYPYCTL